MQVIQLLVDAGADKTLKNWAGKTPCTLATERYQALGEAKARRWAWFPAIEALKKQPKQLQSHPQQRLMLRPRVNRRSLSAVERIDVRMLDA